MKIIMTQEEYSDYVRAIYMCYYNEEKGIVEQASFTFTYLLHRSQLYYKGKSEFNRNALLASLDELCYQNLMVKHKTGVGECYSITTELVEIMRKNGYR